MELANGYASIRHRYHEWRYNLDFAHKAMLALAFACLVGLLAQVRIPLGFTPVPLTGQTFGVLLAGVTLGAYWGGASMLMYVGIGALGMPWFQQMNSGIEYAFGATGGYLVAFVLVAFVVGWLTERRIAARSAMRLLPVMVLSSVTRRPSTNRVGMSILASTLPIWGPPPCTTTGLMPRYWRSVMSWAKAALSSGSCWAAPPYLITTVCP